ncbi:ArnT family glycosyltransferase [Marinobacter caseinilyticus]|uniref:ArnT family glycosyltransferase n=1 Tax=Marinobacter caseinilyticus TaxID=2692195 RepID=UPI00140BC877|nr:glycosyltransferase family 39 protein [Marinobacter caseinilyticus]
MQKPNHLWLWALALVLLSRLITMVTFPLVDTTEPRYAEVARLMVVTGDWVTPWFEPGVPFWGKPPLSFWLQAGAIKAFGLSEFSARLPSWLATLLIVGLIWRYGRAVGGAQVGRWAALIFSTMGLTYISAGAVMTDSVLTLGTTLSLVSFGQVAAGRPIGWRWLFFIGLAIGLLAKGPLAVVLTGVPVGLWALWTGRWHTALRGLPWVRGTLITLALSLPWYVAAELKTPGFLDYFIVGEHFRRFIDPGWAGDLYGSAHVQPKGMIWAFWTWASFPWGVLALAALVWGLCRRPVRLTLGLFLRDDSVRLMLAAALAPLLFFTLAGNTLWTYALPSLPFSALLIAQGLAQVPLQRPMAHRALAAVTVSVPVLVTAATLTFLAQDNRLKTEREFVNTYEHMAMADDSGLLYLNKRPFSAQFYSQGDAEEVSLDKVLHMLRNGTHARYFFAVPHDDKASVLKQLPASTRILRENRRYVLLTFTQSGYDQGV